MDSKVILDFMEKLYKRFPVNSGAHCIDVKDGSFRVWVNINGLFFYMKPELQVEWENPEVFFEKLQELYDNYKSKETVISKVKRFFRL